MPALNTERDARPSLRTSSVLSKRKRSSTQQDAATDASPASTILDICEVLESYDTVPSTLNHPLSKDSRSDTNSASTKRAKLADSDQPRTVFNKARARQYTDLAQLMTDMEQASSDILSDGTAHLQNGGAAAMADTAEHDRLEASSKALSKVLRSLVAQEQRKEGANGLVNGVKDEAKPTSHLTQGPVAEEDGELEDEGRMTVLTLFGNAQGHKQLFSSSQKPIPRPRSANRLGSGASLSATLQAHLPLHEQHLPNQISSTVILPTAAQDALPAARQRQKFHDLFRPRATLPTLTPPKLGKRAATRDSAVTWTHSPTLDSSGKVGFTHEKLPTGHWLGYNGISTSQEPVSPEAKRKQRARTLSTGEAGLEASENAKAALAQAKEDALFRSVYSSFAPCVDDSESIVPEETKDEVWWDLCGQTHLLEMFGDAVTSSLEDRDSAMDEALDDAHEERELKDVVDNFDPVLLEQVESTDHGALTESNAEALLTEISELLESLLSHQRIRNSSLRPNAGQPSSTLGNAAPGPGTDEVKVYETLKTKLSSLVSQLPPYIVSKLDGDQLSDLIISRQILVDGKNYQGVMEEDQASRLAAATALNTALGAHSGPRPTPSVRGAQMTPTARPAGSAYNAAGSLPRAPASTQRAALSAWQTPAQQYASAIGQRGSFGQQSSYNRPLMSGYGQRPGSAQQPGGIGGNYGDATKQPQYQQRAQQRQNLPPTTPSMTGPQAMYQQALQRPAGGYYPQSPVGSQLPRVPSRPQQSSMTGPSSPYAPRAGSVAGSNGSRPHTPATPSQAPTPAAKATAASP